MKKTCFVVLLILGLTSLAHAGFIPVTLTLSAAAEADVDTEFEVTVTVSGLETGISVTNASNIKIDISGGSYGEGILTQNQSSGPIVLIMPNWDDLTFSWSPGVGNGDWLFKFKPTGTEESTTLAFGLTDATGDYMNVQLNSGDSSYLSFGPITMNGCSVDIVPEPATLLLLGLGSLALRKHKA